MKADKYKSKLLPYLAALRRLLEGKEFIVPTKSTPTIHSVACWAGKQKNRVKGKHLTSIDTTPSDEKGS
ncbi:hypothetical protein [Pseudomonas svalbardensis]|uniref:hypothetical protein n=1 Tax=Pseudomonas svalbardensis TaxID=3042029 RepID=UPI0024B3443E|nr:hypothetical protein [Pseudomonas sp. PMCC200367]